MLLDRFGPVHSMYETGMREGVNMPTKKEAKRLKMVRLKEELRDALTELRKVALQCTETEFVELLDMLGANEVPTLTLKNFHRYFRPRFGRRQSERRELEQSQPMEGMTISEPRNTMKFRPSADPVSIIYRMGVAVAEGWEFEKALEDYRRNKRAGGGLKRFRAMLTRMKDERAADIGQYFKLRKLQQAKKIKSRQMELLELLDAHLPLEIRSTETPRRTSALAIKWICSELDLNETTVRDILYRKLKRKDSPPEG